MLVRRKSPLSPQKRKPRKVSKNSFEFAVEEIPLIKRRRHRLISFRRRLRLESANSITHGIGAGISLAGMALLIAISIRSADYWKILSASVYGLCMVLVFMSSTLYHAMMKPKPKRLFHLLDHSAIFLAIAGTYTPICLVLLKGAVGWCLFIFVWILAIAGILFKTKFINRYALLSTLIYVVMGWSILLAIKSFSAAMPTHGLVLFFAGGGAYTFGTVFYGWRSLPYNHMIWHLCVVFGAILHFLSLYICVF